MAGGTEENLYGSRSANGPYIQKRFSPEQRVFSNCHDLTSISTGYDRIMKPNMNTKFHRAEKLIVSQLVKNFSPLMQHVLSPDGDMGERIKKYR
jgi:hypothetical protein